MNISKVIVWMRPDGGMSICAPCISQDDPEGFTEDHALERALKKDVPKDAQNVQILDRKELPADPIFRNAWELKGKKIGIRIGKARELHLEQIRRARARELDKLDKEWMRAKGQKKEAEADAIEAKRQALRDLPETADLARFKTPEEIASFWPEGLPKIED